jgi:hypothetical protein
MGGIYLIQSDDQLVEMTEQAYDSEDLLQVLLAKYPSILAGDQVNASAPRRWLLVRREFGVPAREGGGSWWSLDHLFLDQDGIPTLVEVKRSTNTQIRREVVGQMLDYAANAVVYWPIDTIRAEFEVHRDDPDQVLEEFLEGTDQEEFWQKTKTNLQAGKIRLVFVADAIPPELRRIVEFLNGQMDPAEVLAVEIKQYIGGNLKTLVPRVIGQTADAQIKKSGVRARRQWDEPTFMEALAEKRGIEEVATARKVLAWAADKDLQLWWGQGEKDGSVGPVLNHRGVEHWLFRLWASGWINLSIGSFKEPFRTEERRSEVVRRLNVIEGLNLPDDSSRTVGRRLSILTLQASLDQFLKTFD